jgi:hypothetical protein
MKPFTEYHPEDSADNLTIALTGQPIPAKLRESAWIAQNEPTAQLLRLGYLHYLVHGRKLKSRPD